MLELQDIFFTNLNAVCNLGGYFDLSPNGSWVHCNHKFSQNKFYFVTGGRCSIKIAGNEYIGQAGDWFLIPANVYHEYTNFDGEPLQKYWMHFDIYPNADLFTMLNLPHHVKIEPKSEVYKLFSRFAKVHSSDSLSNKIKEKAILLALISEYISISCPDDISLKSDSDIRIYDILRYINTHLYKPLTNEELAKEFYMHPNQLIIFFKKKTGVTPSRYVNIKKMETAKRLLEDSDLRILEIMEKIGMEDMSTFSKLFKSYFGQSPREYRKQFADTKR